MDHRSRSLRGWRIYDEIILEITVIRNQFPASNGYKMKSSMHSKSSTSFHFTSTADTSYHNQLESLFYFHPDQSRYYEKIVNNVDRYGQPYIHHENERISIRLDTELKTDCLFAFYGPRLAAVLVYLLEETRLEIIHIAVAEDFLMQEDSSSGGLTEVMIQELINQCGSQITGVQLPYKKRILPVSVFVSW